MKVVFIGTALPPKILNEYIDNAKITDIPAYVLGWNIVYGLAQNNVQTLIINDLKMPSFINVHKLYTNKIHFECDNLKFLPITKLNINMIEKISKKYRIYNKLKTLKNTEIDAILVYSLHSPYLIPALKYAKKKNIPVISIVPDLPQFMSTGYHGIKKILKLLDLEIINYLEKKIDGYILLTKHMKKLINMKNVPSIVVEGIANNDTYIYKKNTKKENYILYTGAIEKRYGIPKLINAFIDSNIDSEMWLCGNGDYVEELVNISKKNNKIKYLGLKNREDIIELQQNAMLLVNPRSKDEIYTEYSFPSKTIEYLLSGTPVMMEYLKGIPDEYYKYIILVNNDWKDAFINFYNLDVKDRDEIGLNGRNFIIENKTYLNQGKKIKKFIKEVNNDYKKD